MEREEPRQPTEAERAVMQLLVSPTYPGVEAFREQIGSALVQTDCTCGCGSFAVITDPSTVRAPDNDLVTPSAWNSEDVIEMLMLARDGELKAVEITYFKDASKGVPTDLSGFSFD